MRRALALAMLAALLLAAPARAAINDPVVGVGEQDAAVFDDPHFLRLGLQDLRYVVGWDALTVPWQRAEIDAWMAKARAVNARVTLTFNVSRDDSRHHILPSVRRYRREFLAFRARYPFVKTFVTWNEANHGSQPTAKHPERVARYFDVIRSECTRCTVVAADVLDMASMPQWLARFKRAARHKPKIWGLHNYIDANRFRTAGTKAMLRAVKGEVWFTETGGLVWRRHGPHTIPLGESPWHAARATRWVFRLANLSKRVTRVYLYHWTFPARLDRWDSALMDEQGRPRPAYKVLRSHLRAAEIRASRPR